MKLAVKHEHECGYDIVILFLSQGYWSLSDFTGILSLVSFWNAARLVLNVGTVPKHP